MVYVVHKMRLIKNRILIVLLIFLTTLYGCSNGINDKKITVLISEEIIKSINKDDDSILISLFCDYVKSQEIFNIEVKNFLDFIDGTIESYDIVWNGSEEQKENGKIKFLNIAGQIINIETNVGNKYKINFALNYINKQHQTKEGLYIISVTNLINNNKAILGYSIY
ncbi:hypothetical protein FACS1894132_12670 [Clostridia bacterium]|nr:hypothetical protein FACS1894132_12670 [Clostridia bacterium]